MIAVEGLTKRYGLKVALRDVNLRIREGRITGIIGPDGAGKSTLLKIIAGLERPDEGRVFIEAGKVRPGFMPQSFSLYPDLTVEENLLFFARIHSLPPQRSRQRIELLLQAAGLSSARRRLASKLSGGMKQKLMLICCLLHSPPLLILDEPTTGVDPVSRAQLWELIHRAKQEGATVLLSTSYMDEVEKMDEVVFLLGGRVLLHKPVAELSQLFPYTVLEVAKEQVEKAEQLLTSFSIAGVHEYGRKLRFFVEGDRAKLQKLAEEAGLSLARPTAEDLFIHLSQRKEDG